MGLGLGWVRVRLPAATLCSRLNMCAHLTNLSKQRLSNTAREHQRSNHDHGLLLLLGDRLPAVVRRTRLPSHHHALAADSKG